MNPIGKSGTRHMNSRRKFIKLAALTPLFASTSVFSAATKFTGKFVVTVQAHGGWDVTCFCDPKENQRGELVITKWSTNDEAQSTGNIKYAPFASNEKFFKKHASKMLVINGVDSQTNSHSIGRTVNWSGRTALGYPSLTALYSAVYAPILPLTYLTFGGFNRTESLVRSTQVGGRLTGIRELISPAFGNEGAMAELWDAIKTVQANDAQSIVESSIFAAGNRRTREAYSTSLKRMEPLAEFAETLPIDGWEPRSKDGNLRQQAQFAVAAFKGGVSVAADLYQSGFDTHTLNDSQQTTFLNKLTDGIDYLWDAAEEAGIADRLVVIVGSDFSRTPYYNFLDGKDHWPVGSYIIMEKGKGYTNRYVDGSDEGQNAARIDPETLRPSGFGTKILTSHVHDALREYLGLANSAAADVFPLRNTERFNFFS